MKLIGSSDPCYFLFGSGRDDHRRYILSVFAAAVIPCRPVLASLEKFPLRLLWYKCREVSVDIFLSLCKLGSIFHDKSHPESNGSSREDVASMPVKDDTFYSTNESLCINHDSTNSTMSICLCTKQYKRHPSP